MTPTFRSILTASVLALALAACKKAETPATTPAPAEAPAPAAPAVDPPAATAPAPAAQAVTVVEVQLARAVGDDMRATEPTTSFTPTDAIHAVVLTEGTGSGRLGAQWSYGAEKQPVYQEEHEINATGPGAHNFRITKGDGFPAGDYQVDILLDGTIVATRSFKVE